LELANGTDETLSDSNNLLKNLTVCQIILKTR